MYNKVILMGRLTATPEIRTTNSGKSVTSFSVAVDRAYVKQGEQREADFIACIAWGNQAEFIAKHFGKGAMIHLDGRLQTRTYQTKDGSNRQATEVIVESVSFTGERRTDQPSSAPQQSAPQQQAAPQQYQQQAAPQQYQQQYQQQAAPQQYQQQAAPQQATQMGFEDVDLDLPF